MFFYDSTYILVIIGFIITALASLNVNSTFKKYSKTYSSRGMTGRDVAALILQTSGITDVSIGQIRGNLTDHYSPVAKVLNLSESVYGSTSVAALGVAAHECGHAIQHHVGYAPLSLRSMAVPLANIGSRLSYPVILLGVFLGFTDLAQIGILLFLFVIAFQVITLPVEFDASRRALKILETNNILSMNEMSGARKVLTAAALTYVAAVFSSLLQLLRLIMIVNGGKRRD